MSFLASRDKLPVSTVTAAGEWCAIPEEADHLISRQLSAQCLYVLTDENSSAIEEVRSNAPYSACVLSIVQSREGIPSTNGKSKEVADDRSLALQVLCCGK